MPAPAAPPTEAELREAAMRHLARYSTTAANLRRVLHRRIARWQREGGAPEAVPPLRDAASRVVARLQADGLVSDADFAAARARRLHHSGKSARATASHLAARGVPPALAFEAARAAPAGELAAAVIQLRRRRLGPFATAPATPETELRALGALARAGFAQAIARAALRLTRAEAEARIKDFRDGI